VSLGLYMDAHVPAAVTCGLRLRRVDVLKAQSDSQTQPAGLPFLLAGTIQFEKVSTVWRAWGDETNSSSRASTGGGPNGAAAD
jgi:hypothetical protein